MTKEEFDKFEDEITRLIQQGVNPFVPASELGFDNEDFFIDDFGMDQLYELYVDSCHLPDCLDERQSMQDLVNNEDEDRFAITGRMGYFQWYALSAYFDPQLHKMNNIKIQYNEHHKDSAGDNLLEGPGIHLCKAINESDLVNILRNPVVANTSDMYSEMNWNLKEMETCLRNFCNISIFPEKEIITREGNNIKINKETIKGKDVIIPIIYATNQNMFLFSKLADQICKLGANTAVGIFATRVMPSIDGNEGKIQSGFEVASFSPRFGIRFK